ncbi:hypothetical protein BpHYR1_010140 [Brachionus plicatilis]|uniref:Uncharacterized protein n=1 Tax=Brachionus plicatilis TaxID=10195 RepID=A0A3M7RA49_BRAPC|nr:hypothetical protein BpHYR1_010140 [Brachionus plicatilis]
MITRSQLKYDWDKIKLFAKKTLKLDLANSLHKDPGLVVSLQKRTRGRPRMSSNHSTFIYKTYLIILSKYNADLKSEFLIIILVPINFKSFKT